MVEVDQGRNSSRSAHRHPSNSRPGDNNDPAAVGDAVSAVHSADIFCHKHRHCLVDFPVGNWFTHFLGKGGLDAISKVFSLLLAAIAVSMMISGLEMLGLVY